MAKQPHIPKETIAKAIKALFKWLQHSPDKPKTSRSDQLFVYLILTLAKVPHRGRSLSFPIPLPHPIHDPISLLFDDGPHSPISLPVLSSLNLPITHLIPISEYRSHREIIPSGLLLVDRRIAKRVPEKSKGAKIVRVDLSKKGWAEDVKRKVCETELSFRGGTCCGIKVGRAGMEREEIVENVVAAMERAAENVPKKWTSVRAFHLKMAESLALPIYEKIVEGVSKVVDA